MNLKEFGKRLKEVRKEKHITQSELSEITGISIQAISSYETGQYAPVADYLIDIASALNVSLDYLVCGGQKKELYSTQIIKDTSGIYNNIISLINTGYAEISIDEKTIFTPEIVNIRIKNNILVEDLKNINILLNTRDSYPKETFDLMLNSLIKGINKKMDSLE